MVARLPEAPTDTSYELSESMPCWFGSTVGVPPPTPQSMLKMLDAGGAHVAQEIALDLLAEERVAVAAFVERVEHGRSGDRAFQHGHVGEDQKSLDRALDFGRLMQREVGAHAARGGVRCDERATSQHDASRNHPVSLGRFSEARRCGPPGEQTGA